ncbi:hypothetical protein [Aromatoleum buckelii]|uniref:Uncharacterized protein n=1 Tax=Aromatoleum buckelii TaxID=200254 RepID=A0ABX1MXV7_9RHOO|nr:hypothetical protein [Aromatoleum buckelii]MCK0510159.1 hypothetical protein [Aromatoleum buckelii]
MALDDLLARREREAGTAGTAGVPPDVPPNPLQTLGGTAGTAGTAENDKGHCSSSETPAAVTASPIRATGWLLHYADRDPLEAWFAPAVSHEEVLAAHRGAVAAEPLAEVRTPVRNEVRGESAGRGCSTCLRCKRPGLALGYCGGGRDDLLPAYGANHPLRKLPDDQGAGCASYTPHEGGR